MEESASKDFSYYIKLKERLLELNNAYYNEDTSLVSDFEYDMMLRNLEELEILHPEWQSEDSPTINVGGSATATFTKVRHKVKMESLQDLFSFAEVENFIVRTNQELSKEVSYLVEEKIDGLSISLEYRDGVFWQGATRGDGVIGEDVTQNLMTLSDVPKKLLVDKPSKLVVRGEIYMPKSAFFELNSRQEEAGEKLFANPRNAAAGSLRQLDPEITRTRNLSLFSFNVQDIEGIDFESHYESLEFLKRNGFHIIHASKPTNDVQEVFATIKDIATRRTVLEYGIDGAVIKLDSLSDRIRLGSTSKYPRWAAAYKYPPEQQETKVLSIEVNLGRTGKLTPLAILEPVLVDGSTISRATMHNEDFVKAKDVRVGDTVIIQKAGDIIPEIVEVVLEKRPSQTEKFTMPLTCPVCNSEVERVLGEAATYCINNKCPAQLQRRIEHFVSKNCMDISGLGEKNIELFIAKGFIKDVADIYLLTKHRDELLELPGYGVKSVEKLLEAIEKSKDNSMERLINGLGIKFIGSTASEVLAENVKNIQTLSEMSAADLAKIEGMGQVSATAVEHFFANEENIDLLKKLAELGLNFESRIYRGEKDIQNDSEDALWQELKFVLTGTMETYSRNDAAKLIKELGGKVLTAVSKNVDYLIVGENAGSKLDKAESLNIKVLNEAEFIYALENPKSLIEEA